MQPTPKWLRRLGDGLLGISATITGAAIAGGNDVLAYISLGFGVIGKFLTKGLLKKIPIIGAAISLAYAISRFKKETNEVILIPPISKNTASWQKIER